MMRTGMTMILVLACCAAAYGQGGETAKEPSEPIQPRKLTAYAFISVAPPAGMSKASTAFIEKTLAAALPTERFEKITVATQDELLKAQAAAMTAKADLFLHLRAAAPVTTQFRRTFGHGRFSRTVTTHGLRAPLVLDMRVRIETRWQKARLISLTSADVPGAERDEYRQDNNETARHWGAALRLMVPAACERALLQHFLPNTTLEATECDPEADAGGLPLPGGAEAPKTPQALVKIDLTNRSHCRIEDATVTVEKYNKDRKRWETVEGPRPPFGWPGRFGRPGRGGPDGGRFGQGEESSRGETALTWRIASAVDPGHTVCSEVTSVDESLLQAVKQANCRLVLHATPVVSTLTPSRLPHALVKPEATAKTTP